VTTATFATASTPAVDLNVGLSIKINGGTAVPITVDPAKNTPQGVADAINAAGLDVKAAAVDTGDNKTVLQLTSTKTGTAADFEVQGLTSAALPATEAKDAEIVVGTGAGAYSAFSNTNSFTNLMSGVTLNVSKTAPSVTVEVVRDVSGIADKVKAMVDAANSALADIELKSDPTVGSSPLKGNAMMRQMASSVLSAVAAGTEVTTNGVTSLQSFKSIGVELNRDGRLTFNKDTFVAAFNKDPAGIQRIAQEGLAPALKKIGDSASNPNTGAITQVLKTGENYVRRLKDQITAWDARLELRQTNLKRQYSGLEVALGKLQQQSSWLSGQLAGLG
jgi:flagellar hook-associated protein 2